MLEIWRWNRNNNSPKVGTGTGTLKKNYSSTTLPFTHYDSRRPDPESKTRNQRQEKSLLFFFTKKL
jgi:hypothetical protein